MNTQCGICGLQIISGQYVGDVIGGICQGHQFPPYSPYPSVEKILFNNTESPCPLTSSSHEKALVRVVEKELTGGTEPMSINVYKYKQDFIQVLCSCGHIISENEIK